MIGSQMPLRLSNYTDITLLQKLIQDIIDIILNKFEEYKITRIVKIQFIIKELNLDLSLKYKLNTKTVNLIKPDPTKK
jgi:hypothetical protein